MSFDQSQFAALVVDTLEALGAHIPVTETAARLLLGTAAQESQFGTYLRQLGGGPAIGVFQMESNTHSDVWGNYLTFRPELIRGIERVIQVPIMNNPTTTDYTSPSPARMEWDLRYAIVMARLQYYRVREALPAWDDVQGLAHYWKDHYNTHEGKGTVEEFIENYERYVGVPGVVE